MKKVLLVLVSLVSGFSLASGVNLVTKDHYKKPIFKRSIKVMIGHSGLRDVRVASARLDRNYDFNRID